MLDVTIISKLDGYMSEHSKLHYGNRAGSLTLLAGNLALNFANTESGRGSAQHLNHLEKAVDLITWAAHAKVITESDAQCARQVLATRVELAENLLSKGRALRNTVYSINAAFAAGEHPTLDVIQDLVNHYRDGVCTADLVAGDGHYAWVWTAEKDLISMILGPIALSALTLLTQDDKSRIKQCSGNCCGWLFYDSTKNNSRRWCEMSVCGNRFKVRASRARKQNAGRRQPVAGAL
jgi:predicted RNA-binding Zn ribbon-like protein